MPRGKDETDAELPPLTAGQTLQLEKLEKEQKFTQPPARYSEASLVRELEELGIGRPSTYAAIISTLQDREYVSLKERHFVPTDLGRVVCSQLVEHFGNLMELYKDAVWWTVYLDSASANARRIKDYFEKGAEGETAAKM